MRCQIKGINLNIDIFRYQIQITINLKKLINPNMQQKKEAENITKSSQISTVNSQLSTIFSKEHCLQCILGNTAGWICLNEQCKEKNVFQCLNDECQCQQIHENCKMGKSKRIIKTVDSKIIDTGAFQEIIHQLIDRKIDQLSELRQTLTNLVQQQFEFIDLNRLEKKFHGIVKGKIKMDEFTSLESKIIWQQSISCSKEKSLVSTINTILKSFDESISNSITKSFQEIKTNINNLILAKTKDEDEQILKLEIKYCIKQLRHEVMNRSSICTTEKLSQRFIKIFGRKVSKLSYLFCASQNEFSLNKYFEVCGNVENTVVICKTNKDKIIGAYTPLIHDHQNKDNSVDDASGESFIFSLTDQEKFILKDKSGAITRRSKKDIIRFGNDELNICNRSNINNQCRSDVNCTNYYCPAYSRMDTAANLKFNGNQSKFFTTKEWEVWKVQF